MTQGKMITPEDKQVTKYAISLIFFDMAHKFQVRYLSFLLVNDKFKSTLQESRVTQGTST